MANLFRQFDFRLLDDPDFREDSVREALIAPLLSALGYTESPPYRIIRSRRLEHPYVYIGTAKRPVSIVPDYLLEKDGQCAWILDAKAPGEIIDSGKHVEQAYTYAIHKDVRVPLYGLCNGRKLVVFHVSQGPPVIDIPLQEIETIWPMIIDILGCRSAWPHGIHPGFRPDMGLALAKAGLTKDDDGKKLYHIITSVRLVSAARIEDGLYGINGIYGSEIDGEFMVTFDCGPETYPKFLAELAPDARERVRAALSRQPYDYIFPPSEAPLMTLVGDIGDKVYTNNNESYQPFLAEEFIGEPGSGEGLTEESGDEVSP
jgi:hypothetical protein